jgi:folate-dependent tRNA-U54 methylase TrmFO/GidA
MMSDHTERKDFNGVKVFSATMAQDRERLGERITQWVRDHPECEIVDTIVTQSSDEAFHCLAFTVFYKETL